ncbi:hypothetical protein RND71_019464 [Anisodus tanguticus]|uniref:Uncharacterized protein n=1 Tax=Anisodus tanguticus TaxID=243964 RepID=A0AAE1S0J4_9SOLA|nr:hypothetical protein RND71_019464 [Anisodus tanguticus]
MEEVAFSPNSEYLATGSLDRCLNMVRERCQATLLIGARIHSYTDKSKKINQYINTLKYTALSSKTHTQMM